MKKQLLFFTFLFYFISNAQHRLNFGYDSAGNQTNRAYCFGCTSKPAKEIKEIEAIVEDDLEKFYPEDDISYYPNPVKEELYLKWQLTENTFVKEIKIFSLTGQLLKQYICTSSVNNQNLPFQDYPSGVYAVLINYSNGEQKSIKIVKK